MSANQTISVPEKNPKSGAKARRQHYHVYVVLLSQDVLYEPKFKKRNPDYIPGKPCVCCPISMKASTR